MVKSRSSPWAASPYIIHLPSPSLNLPGRTSIIGLNLPRLTHRSRMLRACHDFRSHLLVLIPSYLLSPRPREPAFVAGRFDLVCHV
jgi:hypothetical protein